MVLSQSLDLLLVNMPNELSVCDSRPAKSLSFSRKSTVKRRRRLLMTCSFGRGRDGLDRKECVYILMLRVQATFYGYPISICH